MTERRPQRTPNNAWKPYTEIRDGKLFTVMGPDQKNLDNQERIRQANLRGYRSWVFRGKRRVG